MHTTSRDRFSQALKGQLAVMSAYDSIQLSADMAAPFLQEANFWWLTGIEEPGWKLILEPSRHRAVLVRPNRSAVGRIFDGGLTDDEVREISGIKEIIAAEEFEPELRRLRRTHSMVATMASREKYEFTKNPAPQELHAILDRVFESVQDCGQILAGLRAIKQPEEIAAIKKAVSLTVKAFRNVRENLGSYKAEYEVEADFTRAFRYANAKHAYEPIVASGGNAVTLHYIKNTAKLAKNKPVLIDIGARVNNYAADITRTYCEKPTKRLVEIHAAVESAHQQIIALLGPDLPVSEYIAQVDMIMKRALLSVNLIKSMDDNEAYRRYFPHAVSHGLGVDVHDRLGAPRYFMPGMVVTVEPGIYIPEEGIGVRIEDDILITAAGHENLSRSLSTKL